MEDLLSGERVLSTCFRQSSIKLESYDESHLAQIFSLFAVWLSGEYTPDTPIRWDTSGILNQEVQNLAAFVRDNISAYLNYKPNSLYFGDLRRLRDCLYLTQASPVVTFWFHQPTLPEEDQLRGKMKELPRGPRKSGSRPNLPGLFVARRKRFDLQLPFFEGLPPQQKFVVDVSGLTWLPKKGNNTDQTAPPACIKPLKGQPIPTVDPDLTLNPVAVDLAARVVPPSQARYLDGPELAQGRWMFTSKLCSFAAPLSANIRTPNQNEISKVCVPVQVPLQPADAEFRFSDLLPTISSEQATSDPVFEFAPTEYTPISVTDIQSTDPSPDPAPHPNLQTVWQLDPANLQPAWQPDPSPWQLPEDPPHFLDFS